MSIPLFPEVPEATVVTFDAVIPATIVVSNGDPAFADMDPYEIAKYLASEFVIPTFSDSDVAFPFMCEVLGRGPVVILGESSEEAKDELARFIDWLYEEAPPELLDTSAPRDRLLRAFRDHQRRREPGRSRREPSPEVLALIDAEEPHAPTLAYLQEVAVQAEADAEKAAEADAAPFDRGGFFGIDGEEWEGPAIARDVIQQRNE